MKNVTVLKKKVNKVVIRMIKWWLNKGVVGIIKVLSCIKMDKI